MAKRPILTESPLHKDDLNWKEIFEGQSEDEIRAVHKKVLQVNERFTKASIGKCPHLVRHGRVPDGYDSWPDLRTADLCIQTMRSFKTNRIVTIVDNKLILGHAIDVFLQLYIRRVDQLISAMIKLWEDRLELPAAILSRAVIENVAMYDRAAVHILLASESNDQKTIYDVVNEAMYSDARNDAPITTVRPPRVSEALSQFETRNPAAKRFYNQISDLVHPNGYQTLCWLSFNRDGEFDFTKSATEIRERFTPIYNALLAVCYWMTTSIHDLRNLARKLDDVRVNIN